MKDLEFRKHHKIDNNNKIIQGVEPKLVRYIETVFNDNRACFPPQEKGPKSNSCNKKKEEETKRESNRARQLHTEIRIKVIVHL